MILPSVFIQQISFFSIYLQQLILAYVSYFTHISGQLKGRIHISIFTYKQTIRFLIQIQSKKMKNDDQEDEIIETYLREREKAHEKQEDLTADDLLLKKQYLKIHVLQVYHKDEDKLDAFANFFLGYLKHHKGIETGNHDLNMLTLLELKQLIRQFTSKCTAKAEPLPQHHKIISSAQNYDIKMQMSKEEFQAKKVYYSNGSWDYQLSGYEECKISKIYFQLDQSKRPVVKLDKPFTKKNGGFFGIGGKLQLWVAISGNFISTAVERKVQDFIFLAEILSKCFPLTFLPPLEITEKQLDRVSEQGVQASLMQRCRIFINAIIQHEQFIQNLFTDRFFREQKYEQLTALQKRSQKLLINGVKMLGDIKGLVGIEISDRNEQAKKDYSKKSELFEKMWRNIAQSNTRIIEKLKEVESEIEKEKKEFDYIITQITQDSFNLHSSTYEAMLNVMFGYKDMFRVYAQNFSQYQFLFQNFNARMALDAHHNWRAFSRYKNQIGEISHEYQVRRKVFLDKEGKRLQTLEDKKGDLQKEVPQKQEKKQTNPLNQSVICEYGIDDNCEREALWIEKYSKWQAYTNSQFALSFQRLLSTNIACLSEILRESAQQLLESRQRQEQSVMNNLTAIIV